jgi:ion channel-forming bestrophin family protein
MIQYDPHKWFDHFFDIRGSLVREIIARVLLCVGWSALVVWFHIFVYPVGIPSLLHTLVGVALGLLLVFRTNASYDRFWEGRKLWGGIVNDSRNLVRLATVHLRDEPELLARLTQWTAAFPVAVKNVLRGDTDLGRHTPEIPVFERLEVESSQHPAMAVALRMTECVVEARRRGAISEIIHGSLDKNIQTLVDYLGGCERIRKTPLPFAYVVHLRRALVLYCFSLPFALVETFGWTTILDVLLLSYTYFGIEEIGVEIEGPFGDDDNDLPLDDICRAIHDNVFAIAGIETLQPEKMPEGL